MLFRALSADRPCKVQDSLHAKHPLILPLLFLDIFVITRSITMIDRTALRLQDGTPGC